MAHPPLPDIKDQRLAAGSAGVVTSQRRRIVGLERIGIGAYQGLGQEGQAGKIAQRAHGGRIDVTSTPEESQFVISMPLVRNDRAK